MAEKSINFGILDRILPEYQKISKAPTLSDLEDIANGRGVLLDVVLAEEAQRKYKSIGTQSGDIFLIQNPVAWRSSIDVNGRVVRHRPKPQFVMSYKDALMRASDAPADTAKGWGI